VVDSSSLARKLGTPLVRFGVWQAPLAWRFPLRPRWWLAEGWSIGQEIRRAIHRGACLHLAIDGPQLVDAGPEAAEVVNQVLSYVAARRDAGQLKIATLGQLADEALRNRASLPTRSILRPAA
jgi:hypothetical protein